jgi:rhodanese-related sulfurtransferase
LLSLKRFKKEKNMNRFDEINVKELAEHLKIENTVLVDVRNLDEVMHGIIESAIHIPLANLPNRYENLLTANHIIFYCHSGIRSAHAAAFLKQQEPTKRSYNLVGGIVAWREAGFPMKMKE